MSTESEYYVIMDPPYPDRRIIPDELHCLLSGARDFVTMRTFVNSTDRDYQ